MKVLIPHQGSIGHIGEIAPVRFLKHRLGGNETLHLDPVEA